MKNLSTTRQFFGLLFWLGICFAVAAIGGAASIQAPSFYEDLVRPQWAPPSWVFGPVWTALYIMMGVSVWLVWRVNGLKGAPVAIALFLMQLFFNALWSWLFFAWQLGGYAFADILLLLVLIFATITAFWRIQLFAGVLLVPYWLWVGFACLLNFSLWRLNPAILG